MYNIFPLYFWILGNSGKTDSQRVDSQHRGQPSIKWGGCLSETNLIGAQLIYECFNVMTTLAFLQSLNN